MTLRKLRADQESLFSNIILKGLIVLKLMLPYPAGIDFSSSTKKIVVANINIKGRKFICCSIQAAMQIFLQIGVSRGEVLGRSIMLYF